MNLPLNSHHPSGVNVARADGGVAFVLNGTGPNILRPLAIRDDGEVYRGSVNGKLAMKIPDHRRDRTIRLIDI